MESGTRFPPREARLKPEFAHLYPALEANRWEGAAVMSDRLMAWHLRHGKRGFIEATRVMQPEHFDFRGGPPEPSVPRRRNDRADLADH
jgi:hypothetical protein